jgi:NADH dehydrogenase
MRQGRLVARNVAAAIGARGRRRKFTYKTLGVFVDLGRYEAVAQTVGIRWRGFPAWFLARTYHMALMPGTARRVRLVTDWTVDLLFKRGTAELGQLGHPPSLDGGSLEPTSSGGTSGREAVPAGHGGREDGSAPGAPAEPAAREGTSESGAG